MDISETDDPSVVGEECHIVARENNGPRGISTLTPEQRDMYNNLILMCSIHHKIIDDNPNKITVDILNEYKATHEAWVKQTLHFDPVKQKNDETYASYIDEFNKLAAIEHWKAWTSYLISGDAPSMSREMYDQTRALIGYITSRIWPHTYLQIEFALINFKNVLNDLLLVFDKYREKSEDGNAFYTRKIYRDGYGKGDLENILMEKYEYHVFLIEDLVFELTRAANFVFDKVREFLLPSYRIIEGVLLIESGPHADLTWKTFRAEYQQSERIDLPYPLLKQFMIDRKSRKIHWGEGVSEDYFTKIS